MTRKTQPAFRIRKTAWDNWYGYKGRNQVIAFTNSITETMEQQAKRWLHERTAGMPEWKQELKLSGINREIGKGESDAKLPS